MPGKTVLFDLSRCNPHHISDVKRLFALLMRVPAVIQMTPISAPTIAEAKPPVVEQAEWGYSGNILFAESHLYFHTWPEHRKMWVDITSCKPLTLDPKKVGQLLKALFGAEEVVYRVAARDERSGRDKRNERDTIDAT